MNKANICYSMDEDAIRMVSNKDKEDIRKFEEDETDEYPNIVLREDYDTVKDFFKAIER